MRQDHSYPRIRQAIGLLACALLLISALSIPVGLLDEIMDVPLIEHPAFLAMVNLIAIGFVLRWGLGKTKASFSEVFFFAPVPVSLLVPMSLTIIGAGILLSELDNLFRTILPMPSGLAEILMNLAAGQTSLWGSILTAVIIAPLTEELLFRGLILHGFLHNYTPGKAVFASALLFGLFHLNPWQFLGATVLGLLFAWWFVQTGSLVPCLFGHALHNAVPLILLGILRFEVPGVTNELAMTEFQPLWLDGVGLLLVGWGIGLLLHRFRAVHAVSPGMS